MKNDLEITEIRKAYFPLIINLLLLLFLLDLCALIISLSIQQFIDISPWTIFFILFLIKYVIFIPYAFKTTRSWTHSSYYISEDKLIGKQGFFYTKEIVHPLKNLVSVEAHEGVLGRILKFGSLKLIFAFSETESVINVGNVVEPYNYKKYFSQFLNKRI